MRLYITRHGQKASVTPAYDGGPNPPLTETGKEQAEHLATFFADRDVDTLYSSCQRRSLQTAQPIHELLDVDWNVWPVFCETTTTRWRDRHEEDPAHALRVAAWRTGEELVEPKYDESEDGGYYPLSSIPENYPGAALTQPIPWPDAWWIPKQAETYETGLPRIELGIDALLCRHDHNDTVVITCHGNCGDKLIATLLGLPRRTQARRFSFANTGVTCMERNDNEWRIRFANQTEHLPPAIRV